ncbi:MAG: hypothetical protein CL424_19340 [Acidimicrobiaceae bacterium]|nr:hypothetical protein [Acidimicrobiaceae bacterium]
MMRAGQPRRDRGSVLILTVVVITILGLVVVAVASYSVSVLRKGQITEDRADRLSAAEGAMRDLIDRLGGDGTLCTTAFGSTGTPFPFAFPLNDVAVDLSCQPVGLSLSETTGWAVVVTGEGVPDGEGLQTQSGGDKVFGGNTYVERTSLLDLKSPLTIKFGDLFYTDPSCGAAGEFDATPISGLSFEPAGQNGLWCTSQAWSDLFPEPDVPNLGSLTNRTNSVFDATTNPNGAYRTDGGCRIYYPGRYTFAPDFGTNAYLRSGDYLFDLPGDASAAQIRVDKAKVSAGFPVIAGDEQVIANAPCEDAMVDDSGTGGATFYVAGKTNFSIEKGTGPNSGSLEIFRREQGTNPTNYVSIHAVGSTLAHPETIISTAAGNNKEMAIHGQIWAPEAGIAFGEVTNDAKGQLLGGAVVASIDARSSASASGFVIQVAGGPQEARFRLRAVASKSGTTVVQVVAQLRFDPPESGTDLGQWQLAVNSWRVCDAAVC